MENKINRKSFMQILGAGAAAAAMPSMQSSAESKRPNIIFIFTDDHASHAISAYGSKINQTPNLDRIANEGIRFDNCFCTNSICAPSRAVILSGKHSHLNGVITNRETFDGSQQTFPKLLQQAGYETAMIGKWHLKSDPTGFDFWKVLIGQGPYYNPPLKTPDGREEHTGYTTDILTNIALDWLQNQRDDDKPFMMMYQHKAPHRNWQPGPDHLTMYDDVDIPEPDDLFDDYEGRTSAALFQEMTVARELSPNDLKFTQPRNFTPEQLDTWNKAYEPKNKAFQEADLQGDDLVRWKYQRYIKDYLRCVASVDDNVGKLLDYLDESGLAENTVVVYSSDQGFYLGDHGWFDKRWMYEESLRMPLMARWPQQIKPGSVNTDLVQNLDFAETFLELAGVTPPNDMQGESLVPLLKGETPDDWRESIYYHYFEFPGYHSVRRHYGVRTKRHKLIHYYGIDEWELFDLETDPDEMKSVHDDPAYAEVLSELQAELERLRKQYKADAFDEGELAPSHNDVPSEMVLAYALQDENKLTTDLSGKNHNGIIQGNIGIDEFGKLSSNPNNIWGAKFNGSSSIVIKPTPRTLNPVFIPFVVGCRCHPASANGVLIANGKHNFGFSLFLEDGAPVFVVRSDNVEYRAAGEVFLIRPEYWYHFAGGITPKGEITLWVNGNVAAQAAVPHFIMPRSYANPGEFVIGNDTESRITQISEPHYKGWMKNVRVYWGEPAAEDWASWRS